MICGARIFRESEARSAPASASWTIRSAPDVMPKSGHDKATFAVAEAEAISMRHAQIGGAHGRIVAQLRRLAGHRDPPVLEHVAMVGDLERGGGELLDQQHRGLRPLELGNGGKDLL